MFSLKEWDGTMQHDKKIVICLLCIIFFISFLFLDDTSNAAEKNKEKQKEEDVILPKNVISISKTNTFPNTPEDLEVIEPSQVTKDLLENVKVAIENPELIKLINESTIRPS